MKQLRRVLFVLTVLLCLALFVAPALAKPPAQRATCNTNGVTTLAGDFPGETEIVGSDIQLSGMMIKDAEGNCKGQGIFVDKTLGLKARILSADWGDIGSSVFKMHGTAEVTVDGNNIGTYVYYIEFYDGVFYEGGEDRSEACFYLIGLPGNDLWTMWYVTPLKGGLHTT